MAKSIRKALRMLLAIASIAAANADLDEGHGAAPTEHAVRIVAFGDSTTFGYGQRDSYPRQLAKALFDAGRSVTVINSGVNGDTTQGGRERFARDVTDYAPDVVLIQFGLNDKTVRLYQRSEDVPSYVDETQFIDNLRYFIDDLRKRGATPVLLTTNPMAWTQTLERHYVEGPYLDGPRGGNKLLEKYVAAERSMAAEEQVDLVDCYAEHARREGDAHTPAEGLMMDDGVHPTAQGYRVNVELVLPTVLPLIDAEWTTISPRRDGYDVIAAGRPCCAYISGRGGRCRESFFELSRVTDERNPRDAISAPTAMDPRGGRAKIDLTAEEGAEWELRIDSNCTLRFSSINGGVQLAESAGEGAAPALRQLKGLKVEPGQMTIEIALSESKVRVEVQGQVLVEFAVSKEGVGPLELTVTAGVIRLQTFHID